MKLWILTSYKKCWLCSIPACKVTISGPKWWPQLCTPVYHNLQKRARKNQPWRAGWAAARRMADREVYGIDIQRFIDGYQTQLSLDKELSDTCHPAKATPPNLAERGKVWSAGSSRLVSLGRSWPSNTRMDIYIWGNHPVPAQDPAAHWGIPQEPQSAATTTPDTEPGTNGPATGQSSLVLALCIATEILLWSFLDDINRCSESWR